MLTGTGYLVVHTTVAPGTKYRYRYCTVLQTGYCWQDNLVG